MTTKRTPATSASSSTPAGTGTAASTAAPAVQMPHWLKATISAETGQPSVKRVGLLLATTALSVSSVLLSVAVLLGHSAGAELAAVAIPLAGMNGYSYVGGINADRKQ